MYFDATAQKPPRGQRCHERGAAVVRACTVIAIACREKTGSFAKTAAAGGSEVGRFGDRTLSRERHRGDVSRFGRRGTLVMTRLDVADGVVGGTLGMPVECRHTSGHLVGRFRVSDVIRVRGEHSGMRALLRADHEHRRAHGYGHSGDEAGQAPNNGPHRTSIASLRPAARRFRH